MFSWLWLFLLPLSFSHIKMCSSLHQTSICWKLSINWPCGTKWFGGNTNILIWCNAVWYKKRSKKRSLPTAHQSLIILLFTFVKFTNQWISLRTFKLFSPTMDRAKAQMNSTECQMTLAQTIKCSFLSGLRFTVLQRKQPPPAQFQNQVQTLSKVCEVLIQCLVWFQSFFSTEFAVQLLLSQLC